MSSPLMFVRDGRTLAFVPVTVAALEAIRAVTPKGGPSAPRPHVLAVYMALLEIANENRNEARTAMSQRRLVEMTGASRGSVQRALLDLRDAGLLDVKERHHDGARLENEYQIVEPPEGVSLTAPPHTECATPAHPVSSNIRRSTTEENSIGGKAAEQQQIQEVFDHWVERTKPKRTTLTPSSARVISKALKEWDVAVLKQAIDGMIVWQSQRGGDLTLGRCLATGPKSPRPLGEMIEWWASLVPSPEAVNAPEGHKPPIPVGVSSVVEPMLRSSLEELRRWHRKPDSVIDREAAVEAKNLLASRGYLVGRNPDGSPYIYEKQEVEA